MTHYTCDRCKSVIDPAQQTRYLVQVEVHSARELRHEPDDSCEVDSLSLLHQMLEGIESQPITMSDCCDDRSSGIRQSTDIDPTDDISDNDLPTHRAQYELCPECYRMYLRNPLGRDQSPALHFSKN